MSRIFDIFIDAHLRGNDTFIKVYVVPTKAAIQFKPHQLIEKLL